MSCVPYEGHWCRILLSKEINQEPLSVISKLHKMNGVEEILKDIEDFEEMDVVNVIMYNNDKTTLTGLNVKVEKKNDKFEYSPYRIADIEDTKRRLDIMTEDLE